MEAILAGMIEGVIVVDPQGRLQLANEAARRMLKLDDVWHRPPLRRDDSASGDRRAGRRGARRAARRSRCSSRRRAIRRARSWRARRRRRRRRRRTARARAARHHRPAARGSDPPRLRRQRLARAAHAADGHPRLRRSAVRGRRRAPREPHASSTIIAATRERMERLVKDLLRLARLDAGQETLDIVVVRHARRSSQAVVADLAPALEARQQRVEIAIAPDAETVRGDPAKLHDALRNLVANAITYAPERSDDPHRRGTGGRLASRLSVSDEGPGIPGRGSVARVRALLPRGQVARARSGRHGSRPGDREAPGGAARRRRCAPRTAPRAARGSRSSCRVTRHARNGRLNPSSATASHSQPPSRASRAAK